MSFYVHTKPIYVGAGPFYGRQSMLRALETGLSNKRCFCIVGGPKTGKTSVLVETLRRVQKSWRRQRNTVKVVPVYIDLKRIKTLDPAEFVKHWWKSLVHALRNPQIVGNQPPKIPELPNKMKDPLACIKEASQTLWDELQGTQAWCEYSLLVDSGDLLLHKDMMGLLQPFTDFVLSSSPSSPSAMVIAGGRTLREYLLDSDNLLDFARPLFLGLLMESEALALIKAGIKNLDEERCNHLVASTGGHPYVLQRLLAEIEVRGIDVSFDELLQPATADILALFEAIWSALDMARGVTYRGAYAAPEHALMQLLLDLPTGCSIKRSEQELGIKPMREYAELLEYMALADKALLGNATEYRPRFGLWNSWYADRIMR